jgi:uncharacterized DUF497 family protein
MEFDWDELKREANILKHGIDFVDAIEIFANWFIETEDRRRDYGERRFVATGQAQGETLRVVYTSRGDRCRIISARRARRNERRAYHESLAEAGQEDEK